MIYFLSLLLSVYFEETFDIADIPQWKNDKKSNFTISECSASHPDLIHNCLYFSNTDDNLILESNLTRQITKFPFLIFFTTHSTLPTTDSHITLNLYSESKKSFSVGYKFSSYPEYFLADGDGNILCEGTIRHEPFVSHSITMIFKETDLYELYIDGMIYGNGTIENVLPITNIDFNISTSNNTIQLGNVLFTKEIRQKWPILISSLLRFRDIERASFYRKIVDAYENELFEGVPFKGKLDTEEEFGKLLSEEEADPRRFNFPFKTNHKNDLEDPASEAEKKFEKDKIRKYEEFEEQVDLDEYDDQIDNYDYDHYHSDL